MTLATREIEIGLSTPNIAADKDVIIDERRLVFGCNEPLRVPYASGWELFKGSFFDRDAAQIAQDRVAYDPGFAADVLLAIAALQGTTFDEKSEEEPGKPHHEWREDIIHGELVPEAQRTIIQELGHTFGGTEHKVTSYVSVDAAVIFLQTLYKYLDATGDQSILDRTYFDKDARSREDLEHQHTLRFAAEQATAWIADTITYGPLLHNRERIPLPEDKPKLLTWQHFNGNGIHNQTLRDSEEAEFHPNGEKANQKAPRADTGLQGLAYDALKKGALLFNHPEWTDLAKEVQKAVLTNLWISDLRYFAQGMDYDPVTNTPRQIQTLCANVGELLDSDILLDLPEEDSQKYISGIVAMLFSQEFLTQFGIRTQGIEHINTLHVQMPDGSRERITGYHGPESVWPAINGRIISGLRHVRLPGIAGNLRARIRNTFELIGCHAEFFNVGPHEELGIAKGPLRWGTYNPNFEFHGTNTPEYIQGWSWSLNEKEEHDLRRGWEALAQPHTWQAKLEQQILSQNTVKAYTTAEDIIKARATTVISPINIEKGRAIQRELMNQWNSKPGTQLYG